MKEYLIAYQYQTVGDDPRWGTTIWRCKMTGVNVKNIEDDIRKRIGAQIVRIMTFSELESDSEGV